MTDSAPEQHEAIADNKALLQRIIDSVPHMVWTANAEGACDFLSARWVAYTSIPQVRQLGTQWIEQIHPDDRERMKATWRATIASGEEIQILFRVRRADGEYRWFDTRAIPLRDAQQRVIKWLGTNTDVHEMITARELLEQNEERLRLVSLATHDAIYDWDVRADRTHRNERHLQMFGALADSQPARSWWEQRVHPEDRQRIVDSVTFAFCNRLPTWEGEYRVARSDGEYADVSDRAYLMYDNERRALRMLGAIEDISERKQIAQALRDSEARLRSAMQAAGLATWIWDVSNDEMYWDDEAYRIWGRTRAEMGKISSSRVIETMHPADRPNITSTRDDFRIEGNDRASEFRIVRPDGSMRWIMAKGEYEPDTSGKPARMVGVYLDITTRKQKEEIHLNAQKLEALGTLAGGIAHDFNNILLAITGNARLAHDDLTAGRLDAPTLKRSLQEITRASERAADLVKRILVFSRHQDARSEVVLLSRIVDETLMLLRPTLPVNVDIRVTLSAPHIAVGIDAIQLQQILMNLVTNAAQAIGNKNGHIAIDVNQIELEHRQSGTFEGLTPGQYAHLSVSDDGCGIDPHIIARIFDPFFTTKEAGQGTGLGLAVVHGIAKANRGAITVDSRVGAGTQINVYLPASSVMPTADEPPAPTTAHHGQGHVLYVDDEDALVMLISRVLERLGYRVTGFLDPTQALAEFTRNPSEYDAVITDLSMHGMNGFELARAIRTVRADVPVIMTSGYVRTEDRETAASYGIRELILKPNTVDELGQTLHRMLQSQPATS